MYIILNSKINRKFHRKMRKGYEQAIHNRRNRKVTMHVKNTQHY